MGGAMTAEVFTETFWDTEPSGKRNVRHDLIETSASKVARLRLASPIEGFRSEPCDGAGDERTAVARVMARFENLTWRTIVTSTTLMMTVVVGVLACGQLLAYGI
jgi:hypothetical protein